MKSVKNPGLIPPCKYSWGGTLLLFFATLSASFGIDITSSDSALEDDETSVLFNQLSMVKIPPVKQSVHIAKWALSKDAKVMTELVVDHSQWNFNSSDPFWISSYEVSQSLFDFVMNTPDLQAMDLDRFSKELQNQKVAAVRLSAHDANEFCRKMTDYWHAKEWLSPDYYFRIPTVYEWALLTDAKSSLFPHQSKHPLIDRLELANLPHPDLLRTYVDFDRIGSAFDSHKTGQKAPFPSGCYDLLGNVTEWIWAGAENSPQFYRAGGKCNDLANAFNTLSLPIPVSPDFESSTHGFRMVAVKKESITVVKELLQKYNWQEDRRAMFRHYSKSDGLPHENTDAIHIDQSGSIWLGTPFGTALIDGDRIDTYTPTTHPGLIHEFIRWICGDSEGRVWMASKDRLCFFDNEKFYVLPENIVPPQAVKYLAGGLGNYVWFWVESGLYKVSYDPSSEFGFNYELFKITDNDLKFHHRISKVQEVAPDILFSVDYSNPLYKINFKEKTITEITSPNKKQKTNSMFYFTMGPNGEIISTSDHGTLILNHYTDDQYATDPYPIVSRFGHRIAHTRNNEYLLSDYYPTFLFRNENLYKIEPSRIPTHYLTAKVAQQGNIFFVGPKAGLSMLWFSKFYSIHGIQSSLNGGSRAVASSVDGGFWATHKEGILNVTGKGEINSWKLPDLPEKQDSLNTIFEDKSGRLWLGLANQHTGRLTFRNGYENYNQERFPVIQWKDGNFVPLKLPPWMVIIEKVNALAEDQQGNIWAGGINALAIWNESQQAWINQMEIWDLEDVDFRMIQQDSHGRMWMGTHGQGLYCWDPANNTLEHFDTEDGLASPFVWSYLETKDGELWFGTSSGLSKWQDGKFLSAGVKDGLWDNTVNQIFEDKHGFLWVGCIKGIYRVAKQELELFFSGEVQTVHCYTYGETDGMILAETNGERWPSGCALPDGSFVFPTTAGFEVMHPDDFPVNPVGPKVRIREIQVQANNQVVDTLHPSGNFNSAKDGSFTEYQSGSFDNIEFQFTASTFKKEGGARFRYRLLGAQTEWSDSTDRHFAYFQNLEPGDYKFEVTATDHNNYRSPEPAVFQFSILPKFYETLTFQISSFIALIGFGFLIQHLASIRLQRARAIRQTLLFNEQREHITRDLHDEIGNDFAKINVLAMSLNPAESKPANLTENNSIHQLQLAAREGIAHLRRILWTTNPKKDWLDQLLNYMVSIFERSFDGTGIQSEIDVPLDPPKLSLTPFLRHQVIMIFKEAISNILKHAQATHVKFSVMITSEEICLSMSDNGVGFLYVRRKSESMGLENMRWRARMARGKLEIKSNPGEGTTLSLTIPLRTLDARRL